MKVEMEGANESRIKKSGVEKRREEEVEKRREEEGRVTQGATRRKVRVGRMTKLDCNSVDVRTRIE